jgi:hypothetical protein
MADPPQVHLLPIGYIADRCDDVFAGNEKFLAKQIFELENQRAPSD